MAQPDSWATDPLFEDALGPIERLAWGQFVICGQPHGEGRKGRVGAGKDVRVIGREVSRWRERKGHVLTLAMITGVYGQGIETLVIGSGIYGQLRCPESVQAAIRAAGIAQLIVEPTPQACATYNVLVRQGVRAALLAHGTC